MSSPVILEEISPSELGFNDSEKEAERESCGLVSESFGKVLQKSNPDRLSGERIGKIASQYYFVHSNVLIVDLGDDFSALPDLNAVGVVSPSGEVLGVIRRESLFNLLGRSFGREVLRKKDISRLIEPVEKFYCEENIFNVGEQIGEDIKVDTQKYYLVLRQNNSFSGIFSGKDLLVYLSDITQQDIQLARKIQTRIVKESEIIHGENFMAAASSLMAKGVGGDFYLVKDLGKNLWFGCLCDVSGKGMAASLLTSVLSGFINTYNFRRGLKTFAEDLNCHLYSNFRGEKYVTGIFFILNERSGMAEFIDMGHSLCYAYKDGRFIQDEVHRTCRPLGVEFEIEVDIFSLSLKYGDRLFMMTDGLIEQAGNTGNYFSMDRIASIFKAYQDANAESLKVYLLEEFHRFRSNVSQHDDITFLILDYTKDLETSAGGCPRFKDKIENSIRSGKPVRVTTYTYSSRMREYIDSLLDRFLMEAGLESLRNKISYCVHELATNAKKANTKRVYFEEKRLELEDPVQYEAGMKCFKIDTLNNIAHYLKLQEEQKLYIRISFLLTSSSLKIVICNNVEMTNEEKFRVKHKLKIASQSFTAVEEFCDKVEDYSEGAGLGIVMMIRMLESMGLGSHALKIRSGGGKTSASLHLGR